MTGTPVHEQARRVRAAWGVGGYASIAAGVLTYGPDLLAGVLRASAQ